jgi:hypothetical protein
MYPKRSLVCATQNSQYTPCNWAKRRSVATNTDRGIPFLPPLLIVCSIVLRRYSIRLAGRHHIFIIEEQDILSLTWLLISIHTTRQRVCERFVMTYVTTLLLG